MDSFATQLKIHLRTSFPVYPLLSSCRFSNCFVCWKVGFKTKIVVKISDQAEKLET